MANNTGDEISLWEECHKRMLLFLFYFGIIGSVSAVVGILGNVTSVIVLVQPSMRSSTSILLVVMAVYDTLLLTSMLLLLAGLINWTLKKPGDSYTFSLIVQIVLHCVLQFAHTGAIYTTVVVTIERAVVVVFPLKAKLVCTKTRASVACVAVFLWSLIYNIPIFIVNNHFNSYNINDTSYQDFLDGYFYRYVYLLYLNTVFHVVLPVGVIIFLNIGIIQRLCMRGRGIIHQVSSRGDNQKQLTVMIIVLTGIFCASLLMFMARIYLLHHEKSKHEQSEGRNTTEQECVSVCLSPTFIVEHVIYIIIILNSATNFIVYSILGHKFRHCLQELCCSRHCLQAHCSPPETQSPQGTCYPRPLPPFISISSKSGKGKTTVVGCG